MTETLGERWLRDAAIELQSDLAAVGCGVDVAMLRYRIGSVPGTRGTSLKVLGASVAASATSDDTRGQIYISPLVENEGVVLATLLHELIHSAGYRDHGKGFAAVAGGVGLIGPWTATTAGAALVARLAELAAALGPYPHAAIIMAGRERQPTRQLRHACPACGALYRCTLKSPIPWCDGDVGAGASHDLVQTIRTLQDTALQGETS